MIEKYLMSEVVKDKKCTKRFIINNQDEEGVHIETVVESLDAKGKVVGEPQITEKYYPNRQLNKACKSDGKTIYTITGS